MFGTNFIMKEAQYLISLKKTAPERVRDTWKAMGGLTCSNDTKVYFKGMIYKLNNEDSEQILDAARGLWEQIKAMRETMTIPCQICL